MSMPSIKPQGPPARLRDRRFYQPIRLPGPDSAWPGTPGVPSAEPTRATRAANGTFPRLRVIGVGPTDHGPLPGNAPEGKPEAREPLGGPAQSLPRAARLRETTEQPLRSLQGTPRVSPATR